MKSNRQIAVSGLAVVILAAGCFTWIGAQGAPEAGAEHGKLGFFVGNWSSEGEIMENPMGIPAGKSTGKDKCDWFEGKFAVVCENEGDGPMGKTKGIAIMSYSPIEQVYTYYSTDSTGMAMTTIPRGKLDGKTWVYDDEMKMGEMTIKNRFTIVQTSPMSYSFEWAVEGEAGWMTVLKGTSRKS